MQRHSLLTTWLGGVVMSKIVSAHQPNFLPYLGFFEKMKKSDIFVIRDECLFSKNTDAFHHRNKIRINSHDNINDAKWDWIGVPVNDPHDYIMHVPIKTESRVKNQPWAKHLLNQIHSQYCNSEYFSKFFHGFEKIFMNGHNKLSELNKELILFIRDAFGIKTDIIVASELGLKTAHYEKSDPNKDLADICRALNADRYLSGDGGKKYLDLGIFEKSGILVEFQNYSHPIYRQNYPGFLPNMSSIDALFCIGRLPD